MSHFEANLLNSILSTFKKHPEISIENSGFSLPKNEQSEITLNFKFGRKSVEVMGQIMPYQKVKTILDDPGKYKRGNRIIISDYLPEKLRATLRLKKVNYMDSLGNLYINTTNAFVWLEHPAQSKPKEEYKADRAFTKTNLKILFLFLTEPRWLNAPYREISGTTGVSLDSVYKTFQALKQGGYIIQKNKKEKLLLEKQELMERWVKAYNEKLRHDLLIGKFRFLDTEKYQDWTTIDLKAPETLWGGEPGADLLTQNFKPGKWIIYSQEQKSQLMKTLRLIPDSKGDIWLYHKFWHNSGNKSQKYASALLIYADLWDSGSPRELEVAGKIYEQYLKHST